MIDGLSDVELVLGAGRLDRVVGDAAELLISYRGDTGADYLDFTPFTPANVLVPEDLAVTILVNSRVGPPAFLAVLEHGQELDVGSVTMTPLEETSTEERGQIASLIATMAEWPGFAASVATKVLHKKRPATIPILDNQAIFGAYMNDRWPRQRSSADSVYLSSRVLEALEWIHKDLTRIENKTAWRELATVEPTRTRIELFDSVWWMYFRKLEPLGSGP